ncbi:restriction endonuclease [Polaromonas sp. JS666]|uniref:restriction endonuclease n=1 Tax=Polaromonas sp. (strain JS666 / ATCC BAA-500) TaxID=296591 RepID=UPI00005313ED|nr:restriction endonuclease [Polaromonas sp. JS666]ABE45266.1 restriction endonuclease [Polaromonas sp. JS666]
MARRKKTSPLEDWLDLVAMLPWWVGVALALGSYVFLHQMAKPTPIQNLQPGQMAAVAVGSVITGLASIGQFFVPIVCLLGALGSFLRRQRRQTLAANVSQSKSADALDEMSWREFEMLVGEAFRLQGYRVVEMGGSGPDGGIDLVLSKGTEKFLVQCKQWKAFKVSVTVVRELYGVMAAKGAAGGFVVTSGMFTEDATAFAAGRNITLIDGSRLLGLLAQAKAARRTVNEPPRRAFDAPVPLPSATLACPACGAAMKKRVAKRGGNAGGEFWGCTQYPVCKGTRNVG